MKPLLRLFILALLRSLFFGCAYRYYLGLHGLSIRLHPEQHAAVSLDSECLQCHDPENGPVGPPTSHPHFTGCLKCHNDAIDD